MKLNETTTLVRKESDWANAMVVFVREHWIVLNCKLNKTTIARDSTIINDVISESQFSPPLAGPSHFRNNEVFSHTVNLRGWALRFHQIYSRAFIISLFYLTASRPNHWQGREDWEKNYLLDAGWQTNFPLFQGTPLDHVQIESSSVVSLGS